MVVLLDLPVEVARSRRGGSPEDRFEGEGDEFRRLVRTGFRELAAADPDRWRVVDASGDVEQVAAAVWQAVGGARKAVG